MALTWNNTGVEPSAEKKNTGYAAGEKLPAGHVNHFLNTFCKQLNNANKIFSQTPSKVVFGVYVGNGETNRQINLGFKPYAVILSDKNGLMGFFPSSSVGSPALMALDGYPAIDGLNNKELEITSSGFTVVSSAYNGKSSKYHYIAFAKYSTGV